VRIGSDHPRTAQKHPSLLTLPENSIDLDGGVATWEGFGVGTTTGAGFAASYAVCGTFQTESPRLARLNRVATVSEYDVDEAGK
jgi:hypothetical protein